MIDHEEFVAERTEGVVPGTTLWDDLMNSMKSVPNVVTDVAVTDLAGSEQ
jgi:hypothetical protein